MAKRKVRRPIFARDDLVTINDPSHKFHKALAIVLSCSKPSKRQRKCLVVVKLAFSPSSVWTLGASRLKRCVTIDESQT